MRPTRLLPAAILVALLAGAVLAEEVRLRDGRVLQGDVLRDDSDDSVLAVRLYATGGVVRLPWKDVLEADRKRLRAELDLDAAEHGPPEMDGHRVTLRSGTTVVGLAENPEEYWSPLVVKTPEGRQKYPRDDVAGIEPAKLPVTAVYTPDEIVERWLAEGVHPKTPMAHAAFADRCFSVGAYRAAKEHYEMALAGRTDPAIERKIRRCELLLAAGEATRRVERVRILAYRKRFDEALAGIASIRKELAGKPRILEALELDALEDRLRKERRAHLLAEVQRTFERTLQDLVRRKVREKPSFEDAVKWSTAKDGLPAELFEKLAADLGIEAKEARELWDARGKARLRRFQYGAGALVYPAVRARLKGGQAKPKGADTGSPADWWASAPPSDRVVFLKAIFAEFSGVLEIERLEQRSGRVLDWVVVCR